MKRYRGLTCLLLAISILLWNPSTVDAQTVTKAAGVPKEITVRFEGGLSSANFAETMTRLAGRDLLPIIKHIDRDGITVNEMLSQTDKLIGTSVAPVLDIYLCTLNKHACDIDKAKGTQGTRWRNAKAPNAAEIPDYECPDSRLPTYVLCLPNVKLTRYLTSTVYSYNPKQENLEQIVVNRSGGCSDLDQRCERVIKELNRIPVEQGSNDKIRLPVAAYRMTLPIADAAHLEKITITLDQLIQELRSTGRLATEQSNVYYTVSSPLTAQSHLVSAAEVDFDPLLNYVEPLKIMNYPYETAKQFYKERMQLITVGIWDEHVDPQHCDFFEQGKSAIVLSEPLPWNQNTDPAKPAPQPDCQAIRSPLELRWDHGTYVTGIVAARINGHGIVGVNPRVLLWTYELGDGERLKDDDDPLFRIAAASQIRSPMLINVSLAEDIGPHQSMLEALIKKYPNILWIAAAGNNGKMIDKIEDCRIIPACISMSGDYLISVVALDTKGVNRWIGETKSSNWGNAFDVAAIGTAVSTLYGNSFGAMAGTSVAAPYVSGLASLLFAKSHVPLTAKQVKERILYTVDFSDAFDDMVKFGRINFTRALEFESDHIQLKPEFCPASGCELTRPIKKQPDSIVITEGVLNGKALERELSIRMADIRRIAAKDNTDKFWIVYYDTNRILQRIQDAKIKDAPIIRFKDGAAPAVLSVSNITDYTCSLSCN